MAAKAHAILSASSAYRWMHCTPSARLEQRFSDQESSAAAEGTAAHAVAEHKLRRAMKFRSKKPISQYDCDEMDEYTDGYVQYVLEALAKAREKCQDPVLLIEQRLDFSTWVPEGFGTGDALIISEHDLHVIDFKYGLGVLVEAERNPQMMLYALGALTMFDGLYDIQTVEMSIYQPRRDNISSWAISVEDLTSWAKDTLQPIARKAYAGDGNYQAGDWCVFCRARSRCKARATENLKFAALPAPPLLSDDEIGDLLGKVDEMIRWGNDLKSYAADAAIEHGKEWPGWKVVAGRSTRKYTNEEDVIAAAGEAGYKDIFRKTLLPITEMEKLMGKKQFNSILGRYVRKVPGKPCLVPETDKRPAIHNVMSDFKEE